MSEKTEVLENMMMLSSYLANIASAALNDKDWKVEDVIMHAQEVIEDYESETNSFLKKYRQTKKKTTKKNGGKRK